MKELWVEGIRQKLRKEKDSRVSTDIHIVHGDKEEFMTQYIAKINQATNIFFWPPNRQGRTIMYTPVKEAANHLVKALERRVTQGQMPVKTTCHLNSKKKPGSQQ